MRVFKTSDGFTLLPAPGGWVDGDLFFEQDDEFWPLDENGNRLEGEFSEPEFFYEGID